MEHLPRGLFILQQSLNHMVHKFMINFPEYSKTA